MYFWVKHLHILLALASMGLHLWRMWRAWCGLPPLRGRLRHLAHGVDTLLLGSALVLIHLAMPWPLPGWLLSKLGLVLLYVISGTIALLPGPSLSRRLACLLAAACLPGILAMAIFKPWW